MSIAKCLRPAFLGKTRVMYTDASVKGAHAGIGINYSSMRRHECYSLPRLENVRQDNNHAERAAIFVAILRTSDDFDAKLFTDSETCIRLLHRGWQHKRFCVLVACTRWIHGGLLQRGFCAGKGCHSCASSKVGGTKRKNCHGCSDALSLPWPFDTTIHVCNGMHKAWWSPRVSVDPRN